MLVRTTEFLLQIHDDWTKSVDGSRLTIRGPNREELIVSVTGIQSKTGAEPPNILVDELWKNALESARCATNHPELVVFTPSEANDLPGIPCVITRARSRDSAIMFCVIAVRGVRSVLFATFEATNTAESTRTFNSLVSNIRLATKE